MKNKILIYTLHKSASMFIYKLAGVLCVEKGIPLYSINSPRPRKLRAKLSRALGVDRALGIKNTDGIYLDNQSDLSQFNGRRACVAPIRTYTEYRSMNENEIILHVRDPRDVLVSLYFSMTYSHAKMKGVFNPSDAQRNEWEEMGIDEFILDEQDDIEEASRAERYLNRYTAYCEKLHGRENVTFVKYEEMITDFRAWLSKFITPFHFENEGEVISNLCEKYKDEFHVKAEDKFKHKRKISQGDYLEKLKPATIDRLNEMFLEPLKILGYK